LWNDPKGNKFWVTFIAKAVLGGMRDAYALGFTEEWEIYLQKKIEM